MTMDLPLIGHYIMLLVVWISNNDSIWYRFQDISTFKVYATGCDLEKFFVFEKVVEITRTKRARGL